MIANISTGSSCEGMVKYNHNKLKSEDENLKKADLLGVENMPGEDLNTIIKSISSQNNLNKNISKPNIHISLSFHKNDILNNNQIYNIGLDYLDKLGYSDQPVAIYRHFDKEHPHIHIVSSQIDNDGKKINDSYLYRKSQRITRELEKKYNITVATEQVGKKIEHLHIPTLINEHLEHKKHSLTSVLSVIVDDVLAKKPTSEKEFDYLLEQHQTKRTIFENEKGEKKGHFFHLLSYDQLGDSFIKDKGINGYDLEIEFAYQSIQNKIELNAALKKEGLKNIMGKVYSVTNTINPDNEEKMNLTELALQLRKKGIELHAKRKQTGEDINGIYSLGFIEMKTGITYSATDLKIKTIDLLKSINDDEKFLKREEYSNKVYIPSKKDIFEDRVVSPEELRTAANNDWVDSLLELTKTLNVQAEQDISLAEKSKKRKKRKR